MPRGWRKWARTRRRTASIFFWKRNRLHLLTFSYKTTLEIKKAAKWDTDASHRLVVSVGGNTVAANEKEVELDIVVKMPEPEPEPEPEPLEGESLAHAQLLLSVKSLSLKDWYRSVAYVHRSESGD